MENSRKDQGLSCKPLKMSPFPASQDCKLNKKEKTASLVEWQKLLHSQRVCVVCVRACVHTSMTTVWYYVSSKIYEYRVAVFNTIFCNDRNVCAFQCDNY